MVVNYEVDHLIALCTPFFEEAFCKYMDCLGLKRYKKCSSYLELVTLTDGNIFPDLFHCDRVL